MPKVGDKEFPYTPEGMAAAKAESKNMGIPVNDGAARSVQEYAGGGKTGYSQIGVYKEGGKTEKKEIPGSVSSMDEGRESGDYEPVKRVKHMGATKDPYDKSSGYKEYQHSKGGGADKPKDKKLGLKKDYKKKSKDREDLTVAGIGDSSGKARTKEDQYYHSDKHTPKWARKWETRLHGKRKIKKSKKK